MVSDMIPLLQLLQTKGVGPRSLARVLTRLQEEQQSLDDFVALDPEEIARRFGLTREQAHSIRANGENAASLAELLEQQKVRTALRGGPLYPSRLDKVLGDKAPPVLFLAGTPELLRDRAVGFCGARDASDQALRCADQVARALAECDLLVVSGHAQGVDETTHRAALQAGGKTGMVLPEGILRFRPRPSLAPYLTENNFVVISEFPPRLPWSVGNAMQRNRTICGLVNALIVIEAGTSGGTFDAGQAALDLGVPLFVLDFPDPAPSGQGNPLLLKKGGQPLPCQPDREPDLTLLLQALEIKRPKGKSLQPTLFDNLAEDA
jgi:DNA protecting protein DprA